jgi:hypothetical protein
MTGTAMCLHILRQQAGPDGRRPPPPADGHGDVTSLALTGLPRAVA